MEDQKIQVKLDLNNQKENVLRVINQESKNEFRRDKLAISGNIFAPSEYWSKRNSELDKISTIVCDNGISFMPTMARVEFDYKKNEITLIVDEGAEHEVTVEGKFTKHPVFDELKINNISSPYTDVKELYQAIKFKPNYFADRGIYDLVSKQLLEFTGKVNLVISSNNDNKGNASNSRTSNIDLGTMTLNFDLFVPLFLGSEKVKVPITIEVQESAGKPHFYLTCIELNQLSQNYIESVFEVEKEHFVNIPIICK